MRIVLLMAVILLSACSVFRTGIEDLGMWRAKADAAYAEQDFATAANYYEKLTEAVPSDAENWFRLGNCYARMQNTTAAVVAYRESLVRDRLYAKAWYNVGFNQLRDAQLTFNDAMDNIPESSPMYPIIKSYNEKLLVLIDEQNKAVDALTRPAKPTIIDPASVEIIVLDEKKPAKKAPKKPPVGNDNAPAVP